MSTLFQLHLRISRMNHIFHVTWTQYALLMVMVLPSTLLAARQLLVCNALTLMGVALAANLFTCSLAMVCMAIWHEGPLSWWWLGTVNK